MQTYLAKPDKFLNRRKLGVEIELKGKRRSNFVQSPTVYNTVVFN
jgi:hypothetical protein